MYNNILVLDISNIKDELLKHPILIVPPLHPETITNLEKLYNLEEVLKYAISSYIRLKFNVEVLCISYNYLWMDSPHYKSLETFIHNYLENNLFFNKPSGVGNRFYINVSIINNNLHIVIKGSNEIY